MRRANYKIAKKKHKKLMEKLINEGKNFNDFVDKAIDLYLENKFYPFVDEEKEETSETEEIDEKETDADNKDEEDSKEDEEEEKDKGE